MSEIDNVKAWDRVAEEYARKRGMSGGLNFEMVRQPMLGWMGELARKKVVELGCGHGWLCKIFSDRGALVTGIDGSIELLRIARKVQPGIRFVEHDLRKPLSLDVGAIDIFVSHMVLSSLDQVDVMFRSVRDAITPAGQFIFTINHPCFYKTPVLSAQGRLFRAIGGYLKTQTQEHGVFRGTTYYRRSLTSYFDSLYRAGFDVRRVLEPRQNFQSMDRPPWWLPLPEHGSGSREFWEDIPMILMVEAVPRL